MARNFSLDDLFHQSPEQLEELLQDALSRQDGMLYVTALGALGREPEDPYLYQQGMAEFAHQEKSYHSSSEQKKEKSLRGFNHLQQLFYHHLETIFYGMHNLSLPQTMIKAMNLNEILTKWYAAGTLKRYMIKKEDWEHRLTKVSQHYGFNPYDYLDAVRLLDRVAYRDPQFAKVMHKLPQRYQRKKGDQLKALAALDETVKQVFLTSFHKPYQPSYRESETYGKFYDPNVDGKSKQVYINAIKQYLQ